ncbi:MAG: condensation domain-containing protein [Clostridia bacterium]|nr:condensation domain-containing protein [Clostridia bacterium]
MSKKVYISTTPAQKLLMLNDNLMFKGSWMNVAAILDINQEIDEQILLEAIRTAMMRNPSTSVRLHKNVLGKTKMYLSDKEPEGIELLDYSSLSDEDFEKLAEKWAQTSFHRRGIETQLYQIKLIRRKNSKHCFYVNFHHMGFDSYAIMETMRYVCLTYNAMMNNEPLPKVGGSPIAMYQDELNYTGSAAEKADLEYWKNFFDPDDEPYFTNLYGKGGKFTQKKGMRSGTCTLPFRNKSAHLNLRIPASVVEKTNKLAELWRVSEQSLHLTALNAYMGMINESDDVTSIVVVARRATLLQKRGGGTLVGSVLVRTKIPRETTSFKAACKISNMRMNESFRHPRQTMFEVNKFANKAYKTASLQGYNGSILCYQPYFNVNDLGMKISFRRLNNGAAPTHLYTTIMQCDDTGDLCVNYEMMAHYYTPDVVEKYHNFMVKFLDAACDNPDKTIAELAKPLL